MSALMTPSGGWKYEINKVIIIGNTWDSLLSNVEAHIKSNGIKLENIAQAVSGQIKQTNPHFIFRIDPLMTIHGS